MSHRSLPFYAAVLSAVVALPGSTRLQLGAALGMKPTGNLVNLHRALAAMRGRVIHVSGYAPTTNGGQAAARWSFGQYADAPAPAAVARRNARQQRRPSSVNAVAFITCIETMMIAPHSVAELSDASGLSPSTVRRLLALLQGVVRIGAWDRKLQNGPHIAFFEVAPGQADLARPARMPSHVATKRYYWRHKALRKDMRIHQALALNPAPLG